MALGQYVYKEKDHQCPIYTLEDPNASIEECPMNHHGLPMLGVEDANADFAKIVKVER